MSSGKKKRYNFLFEYNCGIIKDLLVGTIVYLFLIWSYFSIKLINSIKIIIN
jgi:hypothetical protein